MSSVHSYLYLPSFIFFFTSRTFQQPHLLHIRERERERKRERERESHARLLPHRQWRSRLSKGQSRWRSAFTMKHYHVCRPTATHPPPYHQAGSEWLVIFSLFFFLHICLFWFKFILRIGFYFVFGLCEKRREWEKKRNTEERERIDIIVVGIIF